MILPDDQASRERAARKIAAGGLIAFRTDTFYGLGADPFNPPAIRQIVDLKGREGKPILLLISDLAEAERFITDQTEQFKLLAETLWPGPLTIVSTATPGLSLDLTAGTGTIGVRLPDDESLRELLRLCGGALTATERECLRCTSCKQRTRSRELLSVWLRFDSRQRKDQRHRPPRLLWMSAEQFLG
jgi:L-threonylcarbamoyladenylate synthase